MGHYVMVSLLAASLLSKTRFRFFLFYNEQLLRVSDVSSRRRASGRLRETTRETLSYVEYADKIKWLLQKSITGSINGCKFVIMKQ